MASSRTERLLNLHILLLGARRFLSKDAIRQACYADQPDTPAGDAAFERAFERDKDALRAIGAVIEVGSVDAYFDDEVGYRIPTDQTSLPQIWLEADEAAAVGIAARVWEDATLSRATSRAVAKLHAQGIEIDPSRLDVMVPAITTDEPAFEALWDAVQKRRQVTFDYHRANANTATKRRVRPWGLVRSAGRWYLVGEDIDREAERVFRLSRITGTVSASGKSGAYEVPAGTDVRRVARELGGSPLPVRAVVWARPGTGTSLRRRALEITPVATTDAGGGWDSVVLEGSVDLLADEVLAHGADVYVQEPVELRDLVVQRLRAGLGEAES